MKIQTIERIRLMHDVFERKFSDATTEVITQIIESIRMNAGHDKAEEEAKKLRELIESGIDETELLKKIVSGKGLEQSKEGRSAILIIRSLDRKNLKESTVQKVLSIILDANKKYGFQASEQIATLLIPIVDESENDEELLYNINCLEVEGSYFL